MTHYGSKRKAINVAKDDIDGELCDLHPVEKAEALHELSDHCKAEALEQENTNEVDGVPETPEQLKMRDT